MNETTAPGLTPAQRKALKAQAHHLKPVVMIGDAGLTDSVLAEADRALRIHELIKIRVLGEDRAARGTLMANVCEALDCAPVQTIGKLLVVYRPRGDDEAGDGQSAAKRKRRGPHRPKKAIGAAAESRKDAKSTKAAGGRSGAARKTTPTGGRSGAGRKTTAAGGRSGAAGKTVAAGSRSGAAGKAAPSTGGRTGAGRRSSGGAFPAGSAARSGTGRKKMTVGAVRGAEPPGSKARASSARGAVTPAAGASKRPASRAPGRSGTAGSVAGGPGVRPKRPSSRGPAAGEPVVRSKYTGERKMATTVKKSLSEKTAGKRTDLASTSKAPPRHGAPTKATQGPAHLQGKPGPRTSGRRNRAKGGS